MANALLKHGDRIDVKTLTLLALSANSSIKETAA